MKLFSGISKENYCTAITINLLVKMNFFFNPTKLVNVIKMLIMKITLNDHLMVILESMGIL